MLSLVALTAAAHAGPAAGRVHWWLGSYNENYTSLNNKFISAHDGVDGVMYCCTGLQVLANGSVAPPPPFLSSLVRVAHSAGPAMLPVATAPAAILGGAAARAIPQLVKLAAASGADGLVSDYEPHDNTTAAHARAYADYLTKLASALHASKLKLAVCISDWGILGAAHWPVLRAAGADQYVSMGSTYKRQGIGGGDTVGKAHVLAMQATFAADSLVVGIGSMAPPGCENLTDDYGWDASSLSDFVGWLAQRGVQSIAVWRADIASLLYHEKTYCGVQPWTYPILDSFRNGTAAALAAPCHVETPLPTTFWPPVAEIENFTVSPPGAFNVTGWGRDHYFGATFSNSFASRMALLHAPAAAAGVASGKLTVPSSGTWYVCVRYEAPYHFEAEFTVTVKQGSATRLTKLYGRRSSPKIWAFGWSARNHEVGGCGADPTPECKWTWGATEGWVWEYYPAQLSAGDVSIELTMSNATAAGATGPLADRNLDAVLLTNNLTDIKMRMENEQQLALDGLLSQHDEVYVKVTNKGSTAMRLDVPYEAYHSAYPSQHLICIPYCVPSADGKVYSRIAPLRIELAAGATSDWVEVGSLLDSFNDGTLTVTSNVSGAYSLAVGAKVGGTAIKTIGTFSSKPSSPSIEVAISANTRATGWVRAVDDDLGAALAEATALDAPSESAPVTKLTPIFGYTFCSRKTIRAVEPACYLEASTSASYKANVAKFRALFPLSDTSANDASDPSIAGDVAGGRGYFEARNMIHDLKTLESHLKNLTALGLAEKVLVVSMGDEIALKVPTNATLAQSLFAAWCAKHHVAVPGAYNVSYDGSAARYWYSNLFADQYGLDALATATALLKKYLKNANIGANFSPLTYDPSAYTTAAYLYTVNKGVRAFRSGALTLPWGEDYSWQTPIGSQQMTTLLLDFFRAGKRHGTTKTTTQTMFYTMAHAPGNTPTSWRRNFYGYWAHGMTMLNLYELRPTISSYTENYVATGWGMYTEVRKALSELASFEDLVQSGRVVDGDVGLWCSDAFDIWGRATPPSTYAQHYHTFTAAKRALYTLLLNAELPVDVVIDDDVGATLNSYSLIYLADTHVPDAASAALAKWVEAGGTLVATAGAGMFNELNQTNAALRALLGVTPTAMVEPENSAVQYIKQDLPWATPLGNVTWAANGSMVNESVPIFGARDVFHPAADATVLAWHDDGAPAATMRTAGRGRAFFLGFLPGLSYYAPAIPQRPADRGGTDAAFSHFLPTNFSVAVRELVTGMASPASALVRASAPLVHGRPVVSPTGVVVPLVNWLGEKLVDLNVTIGGGLVKPGMKPTLASGGKVQAGAEAGTFVVAELDVADALVLRA